MKREPSPTKSVLKVQRLDQGLVEGGGGGTGRNQAKNYGFYALLSVFSFFSRIFPVLSRRCPFYDYLIIFSKNDSDLGEKAKEYFSLQIYV